MNRQQRKIYRAPKPYNEADAAEPLAPNPPNKNMTDVEDLLRPRTRKEFKEKPMNNRCCYISPEKRSFGQITEPESDPVDWYQNFLYEFDSDPFAADNATVKHLQELKNLLCSLDENRVEIGSQYTYPVDTLSEENFGQWQTVVNTAQLEDRIFARDEETITKYHNLPKHIHISDEPRVKVIAQKYHKYKQNDIELRKLDEKVVCVEYDVFDKSEMELGKPVQVMRAFFAIKPAASGNENNLSELPSTVKNQFNITSQDLKKLTDHEIEIIDGKILENQSYLRDLRKILQRNTEKKQTHSLNLQNLYEMANREFLNMDTDHTNFLSKDELSDIQKLILVNNTSSAHGISRRAVKHLEEGTKEQYHAVSQTILNELLRDD